jgi:general secretion pathway protein G
MNFKTKRQIFFLTVCLVAGSMFVMTARLLDGRSSLLLKISEDRWTKNIVTNHLAGGVDKFRHDMGRYPTTEEGLKVLMVKPGDDAGKWRGPYLESSLIDVWGHPYRYKYPSNRSDKPYDVWSEHKSHDSSDDIGNW